MNSRSTFLFLACAALLPAQGFGGLLKKPATPTAAPATAASSVDVGAAIASGAEMIGFVTIATDQGMKAVNTMLDVYPADKVAKVKQLSAKYAELSAKRKDGNIDAEQLKVASAAGDEMAALKGDWKSYKKEKASTVSSANSRLGLMLGADAIAASAAPKTLATLQEASKSLASNPMQAGKAAQVAAQITVLTAVVQQVPQQTKSFTAVRGIVSDIAKAEKVSLAADLAPEKIKDKAMLSASAKELD